MRKDFFARVGLDRSSVSAAPLVYIKPIELQEAIALRALVRSKTTLTPGAKLYGLYAADGTPIAVTDNCAVAHTVAEENNFQLLTVH